MTAPNYKSFLRGVLPPRSDEFTPHIVSASSLLTMQELAEHEAAVAMGEPPPPIRRRRISSSFGRNDSFVDLSAERLKSVLSTEEHSKMPPLQLLSSLTFLTLRNLPETSSFLTRLKISRRTWSNQRQGAHRSRLTWIHCRASIRCSRRMIVDLTWQRPCLLTPWQNRASERHTARQGSETGGSTQIWVRETNEAQ